MPDLKDELDALFDNEEKPKQKEAEDKAEEAAEDDKSQAAAKKAKMAAVGARTGGIAARKIPGKAAPAPARAKAPEQEPEPEAAHASTSRPATVHAHSSGGGGGLVKILLVASLILNVLILIFAFSLLGQMGKLQEQMQVQMQTINQNIVASTTMSRAEVGVYTDRGGVDTAILFYLPTDVTKFPQEGKAYRVSLEKLIQNASKD